MIKEKNKILQVKIENLKEKCYQYFFRILIKIILLKKKELKKTFTDQIELYHDTICSKIFNFDNNEIKSRHYKYEVNNKKNIDKENVKKKILKIRKMIKLNFQILHSKLHII